MRTNYWQRSARLKTAKHNKGELMENRPTEELDKILSETKPEGIGDYLIENRQFIADDKKGFYYYYKNVIDSKHIKLRDVYERVDVSESYGSKIVSMEKHTTDRDLIIKMCLAGHFSLLEMNRALKLYGFNPLYARDRRDAVVIVALNNHIYSIEKVNEMLKENGLEGLSKE